THPLAIAAGLAVRCRSSRLRTSRRTRMRKPVYSTHIGRNTLFWLAKRWNPRTNPSEGLRAPPRAPAGEAHRGSGLPPDLPAVPQKMIGQHAGHHGFADRDRANADTRVVTPLGDDVGLAALAVDSLTRRQDRRGRLDRKTHHDRLPGGDAAQN